MTFDILDLALLPALALICGVTCFSDVREGKIRNRWLLRGALWAVAVYAVFSFSRLLSPDFTSDLVLNTLFDGSWQRLLLLTGVNALFALVSGFLLFHFDLWSAGDAKLFFVLVLLLPLKYYFRYYLPFFPAFNLFLNTITVAAVFVWGETAWKLIRFASAGGEKNVWKEIAGASLAGIRGSAGLLLTAGVVFSLLMCATHFWELGRRVSVTVTLLVMVALLFSGNILNEVLKSRLFRIRLGFFSAVFFSALLLSSLRLQFLRMALVMSATFLALYFPVGILPSLAQKYEIEIGDMPFATWLTVGLLFTMLIRGSLLYLALY